MLQSHLELWRGTWLVVISKKIRTESGELLGLWQSNLLDAVFFNQHSVPASSCVYTPQKFTLYGKCIQPILELDGCSKQLHWTTGRHSYGKQPGRSWSMSCNGKPQIEQKNLTMVIEIIVLYFLGLLNLLDMFENMLKLWLSMPSYITRGIWLYLLDGASKFMSKLISWLFDSKSMRTNWKRTILQL